MNLTSSTLILAGALRAFAASAQPAPDYAFLAPAGDTWQVWEARDGSAPRPVTSDPADKVFLSASAGTGEMLALTDDGTGTLLDTAGHRIGTVELGRGAEDAALSPDGAWIVFTRQEDAPPRDRDLWIAERSGRGAKPLLRAPGMQHAPAWSPDGTVIAYSGTGPNGGEDLWRMRLDGSEQSQLTVGMRQNLDPVIGPQGEMYYSTNRGGDFDIWRLDATGMTARAVAQGPGRDSEPRISADGRRLLFVSRRTGRAAVWSSAADGSEPRLLAQPPAEVRHPVWVEARRGAADPQSPAGGPPGTGGPAAEAPAVPSGGRIAFLRLAHGRWQPWSIRPDGTDPQPLAELPLDASRATLSADGRRLLVNTIDGSLFLVEGAQRAPRRIEIDPGSPTDAAISPDGTSIAYSVNTLGGIDSNDIWIVPAQGGRAKRLTDQPFLQHFPVWSPNGRDVLYLSGRGGQTHDVWKVGADATTPRALVSAHSYNFEPSVSAKGDIVFSSNQGGGYDLWILEAGSAEPRRLTTDPAYDGQPSFSPAGDRIVFVSRRDPPGLWIHDLDTHRESPLRIDGDVRLPFWYRGDESPEAREPVRPAPADNGAPGRETR